MRCVDGDQARRRIYSPFEIQRRRLRDTGRTFEIKQHFATFLLYRDDQTLKQMSRAIE